MDRAQDRRGRGFVAFVLGAAMLACCWSASGAADDPMAKGEAVARESDRRDVGFGSTKATLTMVLETEAGHTSERRMRMLTLEVPEEGQGDKSMVIFDRPRDIKGTALLSHGGVLEPDDQWLYLPALKRVKRISSSNRSGPFVGSEFSYEDITGQEFGKYAYTWLGEEACGDAQCFAIERRPLYENSAYTRLVTWYDTIEYRMRRVDYYDRDDRLLKTLTLGDYQRYLGRYWRAHEMHMVNHQTGKRTRLVFDEYQFDVGLTDRHFTQISLKRAR